MAARNPLSGDGRGQLHRRFTTNNIPTLSTPLSPIGQQRRQAAEPTEFTTATYHKLQVLERKKLEYEYLKEQKRRFEAEMELIDMQSKQDEAEITRLSSDIKYGKHSQPTTPPEYSDINGFPTALSHPHRFSISSIASPPGMGTSTPRGSRSGSQLMSPPSVSSKSTQPSTAGSFLPSKSVPGSRRGSDEDSDSYEEQDSHTPLSPARVVRKYNRLSMPVTANDARSRGDNLPDLASVLGHINTADFLFDDDDKIVSRNENPLSSPGAKPFNGMSAAGGFPSLMRGSDINGNVKLSANSAALDLALSQSPGPESESQANGWAPYATPRHAHRHSQQSLPTNTFRKASQVDEYDVSKLNGNKVETTPTRSVTDNRRSVEFNFGGPFSPESKRSSFHNSPANGAVNGMPKLTSSYSANDIPTLKNGNGVNGSGQNGINSSASAAFNTHAEQHLHNHNASIGRVPTNAFPSRHSRETSGGYSGGLHASAAPFGPAITSAPFMSGITAATVGSPTLSQYSTAPSPGAYYGGYGLSMLNASMGSVSLGAPVGSQQNYNPVSMQQMYPGPQSFGYNVNPYVSYGPNGRVQDSQARVIQSRRMQNDSNRFMNYDLKTMPREEIYSLCKDQHGCRFLQKKLEERNPEYLDIIFSETAPHVVELMTDPFGNYLCQKLLEYTTNDQRDILVRNAAPSLVQIALNQHGTRALQKMIEFISTNQQIAMITQAFAGQVVSLIKDLNGNHVIQKCLNHLKAQDAQFIFDAVGANCVAVGTHRHGCCVIQRCIDHASGFQKAELVRQITAHSITLVQDPFGNYVVQYILDLNEPSFTDPLCLGFRDRIGELSKQKFSSNVMEKCIRCAGATTKRIMIEELMDLNELEKLMRDSYGNYVIQTALEFAPPDQCMHLIENMRPILPAIRQTPYGRRIQSKVQERESRLAALTGRASGHVSPHTLSTTQSPEIAGAYVQMPASSGYSVGPMYATANNYGGNIVSPQPHRLSNPPLPRHLQNAVQDQRYQQQFRGPQFGSHQPVNQQYANQQYGNLQFGNQQFGDGQLGDQEFDDEQPRNQNIEGVGQADTTGDFHDQSNGRGKYY
ncbi:ARM repeat-containing protein [Delitschia confertaspora ATCC 74209]|uniref:ARM repeat-containing protein n=1 Tax=Delitschia confertaspora ATCC 74209 TaxID=1513339 RepID=A0A9P4JU73_9PLEO|nr:ARM repeat-containing protein [Delitschia confertaspora ATCC 74209]